MASSWGDKLFVEETIFDVLSIPLPFLLANISLKVIKMKCFLVSSIHSSALKLEIILKGLKLFAEATI